jgi:hypothetical protein
MHLFIYLFIYLQQNMARGVGGRGGRRIQHTHTEHTTQTKHHLHHMGGEIGLDGKATAT